MSEKIYAGSGKIIDTPYGKMPKITFHKDNINTIVKYMKDNKSDFCTLVMKQKREIVEGKTTHYLEIDQWKPKQDDDYSEKGGEDVDETVNEVDDSGVPF